MMTQTILVESYAVGDLHRRDIAGIWKLSGKCSFLPRLLPSPSQENKVSNLPLKEFTVCPIKNDQLSPKNKDIEEEILLMLKEDGQFMQYGSISENDLGDQEDTQEENQNTIMSSKKEGFNRRKQLDDVKKEDIFIQLGIMRGTWDLVEGKLILAADRPKDSNGKKVHDTILVGNIVATEGQSLEDNPVLLSLQQKNSAESEDEQYNMTQKDNTISGKNNKVWRDNKTSLPPNQQKHSSSTTNLSLDESLSPTSSLDVHLSVPKGKVKIGKFMYPRKHPSFFDQPLFNPTQMGSFELKQVLGTMNTQTNRDVPIEKFKKQDLMSKRYFLTSYPIRRKHKRRQRWSIKYNKFVDEKPMTNKEKLRREKEDNSPVNIRTFEVELFANNTFSTIAGLGDTVIRGKWWIIGNDRDQLVMQVWRFGFGRSVSGSTFSEGSNLSDKDEVVYWGQIYEVDGSSVEDSIETDPMEWKGKRIEINGSVMDGWGLEPCSVASFTMVEVTEDFSEYDDDDDDDDDEEDENNNYDDYPDLGDVGVFE